MMLHSASFTRALFSSRTSQSISTLKEELSRRNCSSKEETTVRDVKKRKQGRKLQHTWLPQK